MVAFLRVLLGLAAFEKVGLPLLYLVACHEDFGKCVLELGVAEIALEHRLDPVVRILFVRPSPDRSYLAAEAIA